MATITTITTNVAIHGVPLEVEYTRTENGDILISEVWVVHSGTAWHIEMLALLDECIISQIRNEIAKRVN